MNQSVSWRARLAHALKVARKQQGLSLRETQTACGVEFSTLSRIENGRGCEVDTLARVCRWCGVSADYVLNGEAP